MENNIFSKNLKFLRERNGLATKELAQGLKVVEEIVVSWEIGAKNPEVMVTHFNDFKNGNIVNINADYSEINLLENQV